MNEIHFLVEVINARQLRLTRQSPVPAGLTVWELTVFAGPGVWHYSNDDWTGDWVVSAPLGAVLPATVLELRLEAKGNPSGARTLANAFITTPLVDGQAVWVSRNNALYDITAEGQLVDGSWSWTDLDTFATYTAYQIRQDGGVVSQGQVTVVTLDTGVWSMSGLPEVLAAATLRLVVTWSLRQRWAECVRRLVAESTGPAPVYVPVVHGRPVADRQQALVWIGQRLSLLEQTQYTDTREIEAWLRWVDLDLNAPTWL